MINLLTEHWHNQSPKKSVEEDKHFSRKCTKPTYVHRLLEKSSYNIDISYNFTANWDWSTIHQEVDERKSWSLNWPDFDIKQPSWQCKTKHHWAMLKTKTGYTRSLVPTSKPLTSAKLAAKRNENSVLELQLLMIWPTHVRHF